MEKQKITKKMRQTIREKVTYLSEYDIEGKLDDVIGRFTEIRNEYGGQAYLEIEKVHDYYDSWHVEYQIYVNRLETDEEVTSRLAREEAVANAIKEKERAQYELLRQKFEKTEA